MAAFPEHYRPDKLGVVVDFWPGKAKIVRVWEVECGAMERPLVAKLIEGLKRSEQIAILRRLNLTGEYDDELLVPMDENDPRLKALNEQLAADMLLFEKSRA